MARNDVTIENGKVVQNLYNRYTKTWNDIRVGVENPGWREQIRTHRNATTGYSCTFKSYYPQGVSASGTVVGYDNSLNHVRERAFSGVLFSDWGDTPDPSGMGTSTADLNARMKFVSKYREKRTQFQAGIFLGELAQTVSMIANPAKALRAGLDSYYRYVKRRVRRGMSHSTRKRIIQDSWLEYSYGVRPLVSDVEDACRLATADPYAVFLPLTGRGKQDVYDDRSKRAYTYGHTKVWCTDIIRGSVSVKYKGAIQAQNQPPSFPEQLGLSWSNVLPTVWELIPYSFLVDYFTNVGKVIEGVSTGFIRLAWGAKMTVKEYTYFVENVYLDKAVLDSFIVAVGGRSYGYATGGGQVGSRTTFIREGVGGVSVGIGDLGFKLPGSGTKWLNIGALARLRT
jgi:hypothetical protein